MMPSQAILPDCPHCNGSGDMLRLRQSMLGDVFECPECGKPLLLTRPCIGLQRLLAFHAVVAFISMAIHNAPNNLIAAALVVIPLFIPLAPLKFEPMRNFQFSLQALMLLSIDVGIIILAFTQNCWPLAAASWVAVIILKKAQRERKQDERLEESSV
jgi:hypothetical protein